MSTAEIFILVLMGIIALQMLFMHLMINASLKTMRSCSETSDKAFDLTFRALDELVARSPQEGAVPHD